MIKIPTPAIPAALTRRQALATGGALIAAPWVLRPAAGAIPDRVVPSELYNVRLKTIATELKVPWSVAFLPDGDMLVTLRGGDLVRLTDGGKRRGKVSGVPKVVALGQGGLLDVIVHPDHASNGVIYLTFSEEGDGGAGTAILRARLQGDTLSDQAVIFRALPKSTGGRHFGSRMVFGPDGMLYATLGERGDGSQAQMLDRHPGSIIRIAEDGSVPADNPFVGRDGAKPELWTYGNRNPQGLTVHPDTGVIWASEHGPKGGDEINIVEKGANYGWPVITHGLSYAGLPLGEGTEKEGVKAPLHVWTPSIAPAGLTFVTDDRYGDWKGDLLVGALKFELLVRLRFDGTKVVHEERMLEKVLGRIRDVRRAPDGSVHLLSDARDGRLVQLSTEPLA